VRCSTLVASELTELSHPEKSRPRLRCSTLEAPAFSRAAGL
jgi:hypothetical protein